MNYLIGHLVGDYLLQNDWMAQNKKKSGLIGFNACNIHCMLWTLSVMLFTGWWGWSYLGMIFFSHWIFDRTNICMWWMKVTKKSGTDNPFFPLIYVAVDNTCHLVLLFCINKFIIGG